MLVSPIAFENQSAKRDLPNGEKENANLTLYAAAIERVAKKHGLTFIDLFTPTKALYAKAKQPLTTGGFVADGRRLPGHVARDARHRHVRASVAHVEGRPRARSTPR